MEIPECLIADILTRLPIKSILRFRGVCKSWYAILPNPEVLFSTDLFTVDPDYQILYKHHQKQTAEVFSLISLNNLAHMTPTRKLPRVNRTVRSIGYTDIAGCCNGIVLLKDGLGMCLCNPATDETKVLPEFKLFRDDNVFGGFHYVGFCFDAKTSDFKVILVFGPTKAHERDFVYSLRSDSWKTVEARSPQCSSYDSRYDIAMNSSSGMCHWFGSYLLGKRSDSVIQCEIWAMLEVGVKESWIKVMTIGPTVPFRKFLRFGTNRKVFLQTSGVHEEVVVIFDPLTRQTSPFLRNTNMPRFMLATNYKKSQVRLGELSALAGQLH